MFPGILWTEKMLGEAGGLCFEKARLLVPVFFFFLGGGSQNRLMNSGAPQKWGGRLRVAVHSLTFCFQYS